MNEDEAKLPVDPNDFEADEQAEKDEDAEKWVGLLPETIAKYRKIYLYYLNAHQSWLILKEVLERSGLPSSRDTVERAIDYCQAHEYHITDAQKIQAQITIVQVRNARLQQDMEHARASQQWANVIGFSRALQSGHELELKLMGLYEEAMKLQFIDKDGKGIPIRYIEIGLSGKEESENDTSAS